ncbi:MAG: hypothetical protein WCF67_19020 [Chitinophagaceae bacterium]
MKAAFGFLADFLAAAFLGAAFFGAAFLGAAFFGAALLAPFFAAFLAAFAMTFEFNELIKKIINHVRTINPPPDNSNKITLKYQTPYENMNFLFAFYSHFT